MSQILEPELISPKLARQYIRQYFHGKAWHCGGEVSEAWSCCPWAIATVRETSLPDGIDRAHALLEKQGFSRRQAVGQIENILADLARNELPNFVAGGMLLLYLWLVSGIDPQVEQTDLYNPEEPEMETKTEEGEMYAVHVSVEATVTRWAGLYIRAPSAEAASKAAEEIANRLGWDEFDDESWTEERAQVDTPEKFSDPKDVEAAEEAGYHTADAKGNPSNLIIKGRVFPP